MSIYFKYAPEGTNIIFLSHVDDFVYWYNSEALGKWFVDTLGKRFHVNFLGYAHWFISIIISQMKDNYMPLLLLQNTWILPQLSKLQSFIKPIFHLI